MTNVIHVNYPISRKSFYDAGNLLSGIIIFIRMLNFFFMFFFCSAHNLGYSDFITLYYERMELSYSKIKTKNKKKISTTFNYVHAFSYFYQMETKINKILKCVSHHHRTMSKTHFSTVK